MLTMEKPNIFILVGIFLVAFLMWNLFIGMILMSFPFLKECSEIAYFNSVEKTCTLKSGIAIIANILSLFFAFKTAKFAYDNPDSMY
jgi:hypothetical protein